MNTMELAQCLSNGVVCYENREESLAECPWVPHPSFEGVHLKHLIKGADTGGQLSCHLVRVEPGKALQSHTHEGQWELHEVVEGQGTARLGETEIPYHPGRMTVIPQNAPHSVQAGDQGVVLLAKFFPALV